MGRPKKRSAMVRFERNKERGKGLRGIGYVGFWMSVVVVFVGEAFRHLSSVFSSAFALQWENDSASCIGRGPLAAETVPEAQSGGGSSRRRHWVRTHCMPGDFRRWTTNQHPRT